MSDMHAQMANTVPELRDIAVVLRTRIKAIKDHTARLESELKAVQDKIERLAGKPKSSKSPHWSERTQEGS